MAMIDAAKRDGFRTARLTVNVMMLCLFCWLLFSNPDSNPLSQPVAQADIVAMSDTLDEPVASVLIPYSSASNFEHPKQAPRWQFEGGDENVFSVNPTYAHLLTESIAVDWFLTTVSNRFRLSGWKDLGLQYRIKNAFIEIQ